MRVRKRPTEYEAVQWTGDNPSEVEALIGRSRMVHICNKEAPDRLLVLQDTGMDLVRVDSWVLFDKDALTIKTVSPVTFEVLYEEVTE